MSSLRDEIINTDDRKYIKVVVPEWGNREIWLCSPESKDRDNFEASLLVERKKRKANGKTKTVKEVTHENMRAKLVVMCVCEGEGNPTKVFKPEDAAIIGVKNAAAIDRLFDAAQKLAGISDDDLEELAGN